MRKQKISHYSLFMGLVLTIMSCLHSRGSDLKSSEPSSITLAWHPTERHVPKELRHAYGPLDLKIGTQIDCQLFLKEHKAWELVAFKQFGFFRLIDCPKLGVLSFAFSKFRHSTLWFGFSKLENAKTFLDLNKAWLKRSLQTRNIVIELLAINHSSEQEIADQIAFQDEIESEFSGSRKMLHLIGPRFIPDRYPIRKTYEMYQKRNKILYAFNLLYDRQLNGKDIWPEQKLGFDTYFDFTHDIQGESPVALNYPPNAQMVAEYQQTDLSSEQRLAYLSSTLASISVASVQAENKSAEESKAFLKFLIYGTYNELTDSELQLSHQFRSVQTPGQSIYWPLSHPAVGDPWDNPFVPSLNTYPIVGMIFGSDEDILYALLTNMSAEKQNVEVKNDIQEDGTWQSYEISEVLFSSRGESSLAGTALGTLDLGAYEVLLLKLQKN